MSHAAKHEREADHRRREVGAELVCVEQVAADVLHVGDDADLLVAHHVLPAAPDAEPEDAAHCSGEQDGVGALAIGEEGGRRRGR